jgi:hypothetical protein
MRGDTMSFSAIIPAANADAANAALDAQGFGPSNFAVPCLGPDGGATHVGFHCWAHAPMRAAVAAMPAEWGVSISDAPLTPVEQFGGLAAGLSIAWPPADDWMQTIPQAGDVRTFGGVEWRSLIPNNIWSPAAYPQGWELVAAPPPGPLPWVQPTGAHNAYALNAVVTHAGQTWRSTYANNVWEPGVFGWVIHA